MNVVMKDIVANKIYDHGQKYNYWQKKCVSIHYIVT